MGRPSNPSPCCEVRSDVRVISFDTGEVILRCSRCGQLRIEPIDKSKRTAAPGPRLRLVVNR